MSTQIFDLTPLMGEEIKNRRISTIKVIGREFAVESKTLKVVLLSALAGSPIALAFSLVFGAYAFFIVPVAVGVGAFLFLMQNKQTGTDNFKIIKTAYDNRKLIGQFVLPTGSKPVKPQQKQLFKFVFAGDIYPNRTKKEQ